MSLHLQSIFFLSPPPPLFFSIFLSLLLSLFSLSNSFPLFFIIALFFSLTFDSTLFHKNTCPRTSFFISFCLFVSLSLSLSWSTSSRKSPSHLHRQAVILRKLEITSIVCGYAYHEERKRRDMISRITYDNGCFRLLLSPPSYPLSMQTFGLEMDESSFCLTHNGARTIPSHNIICTVYRQKLSGKGMHRLERKPDT